MGGVDLADQFPKYCSVDRSCKKWYKYLFWFTIGVSVCNAFIAQNHFLTGAGKAKLKQVDFALGFQNNLLQGFTPAFRLPSQLNAARLKIFPLGCEMLANISVKNLRLGKSSVFGVKG